MSYGDGFWSGKVWDMRYSFNAEHYYARIRSPEGELMDVEQLMTAEYAKELSDKSERSMFGGGHRFELYENEPTNRFKLADEARGALVCALKHLCQPGQVAVIGDTTYVEPHEPIAGPEEFMGPASELWLEWVKLLKDSNDRPAQAASDALGDRWQELMKPYRTVEPDGPIIYRPGDSEREREHPRDIFVRPDEHGVWEVFTGNPYDLVVRSGPRTTRLTTPSEETP